MGTHDPWLRGTDGQTTISVAMDCPDDETLASLSSGTLTAADRLALVDHAAACATCHALVAALFDAAPAAAPRARQTIDRYQVLRPLGMGGMGVVYAAHDPELGRDVAIKVLRGRAIEDRLRREAQALARLHHPNVVSVYDVGTDAGQTFVAMALVDGQDLRGWLEQPRTTDEILQVLLDAGRGLAAAHAAGLIHRDLKPDNVFVSRAGPALVGDFGLARGFDRDDERPPATAARASGSAIAAPLAAGSHPTAAAAGLAATLADSDRALAVATATGTVLGTPAYMAPEQATGTSTPASDQFSFCVTAWEALFGSRPFAGKTLAEILGNVATGTLAKPSRERRVPVRVHRALVRGLRADPRARFPSVAALLRELAPPRRRWPIVAAAGAVLATSVVAAIALTRSGAPSPQRCRTADQRLAGVWDPARRSTAQAALTTVADSTTATRILADVDAYRDRWRAGWQDACTSTEQSATMFDLRIACLERRRTQLDAVTAALAAATPSVAANASQTVDGLAPVTDCADVATLARELPPPPEQRDAIAKVRGEIDQATIMIELGKFDDALRLAEAAVVAARAIAFPPLVSAALRVLGGILRNKSDYPRALAALRESVTAAMSAGDDALAAQTFIEVADLLVVTGDLAAAELQLDLADAAVVRLGTPRLAKLDAQLESARSAIKAQRGEYAEALVHIDAALAAYDRDPAPHLLGRAGALTNRGEVLMNLDRPDDAAAALQHAVDATAALVGADHPLTAIAEDRLARTMVMRGQYEPGLALLHQVRTKLTAAVGGEGPDVAQVELAIAAIASETGDHAAAFAMAEHCVPILAGILDPTTSQALGLRRFLARLQTRRGELADADARLTELLAAQEKAADAPISIADTFTAVGELRLFQQRPADALAAYDRAGDLVTQALGPDRSELATVWAGRGRARLALRDDARARADLEKAEPLLAAAAEPLALAETRLALAEARWRAGDRAAALAMIATAPASLDQLSATGNAATRAEIARWKAAHAAE